MTSWTIRLLPDGLMCVENAGQVVFFEGLLAWVLLCRRSGTDRFDNPLTIWVQFLFRGKYQYETIKLKPLNV